MFCVMKTQGQEMCSPRLVYNWGEASFAPAFPVPVSLSLVYGGTKCEEGRKWGLCPNGTYIESI